MRVSVLTISDRAASGVYEDTSGPSVEQVLRETYPDAEIVREIVPDEEDRILDALSRHSEMDVILTTGGTGLSARDITPEATARFCDKEVPGIAEALRAASFAETANAMFSRAKAGIKGRTLVVNLPGSAKGARFCAAFLSPSLAHAVDMMRGKGH